MIIEEATNKLMCPQGRAAVAAGFPEKIKINYILNYYSNFDVKVNGTKLFLKSHLYMNLLLIFIFLDSAARAASSSLR